MAMLGAAGPDEEVYIDVKPWDESLSLASVVGANHYDKDANVVGCDAFLVLQPSTEGATRLDPLGQDDAPAVVN